jgi:ligand-binding sensor domain-containing protein
MKKLLLYFFCIAAFNTPGFTQNVWKNYSVLDGLPDNYIQTMEFDNKGNLWIGTSVGAACFDGKRWQTYTIYEGLPDNNVQCIAIEKNGTIWFATYGGACRFDGFTWSTYIPIENGSSIKRIKSIAISTDGIVFMGSDYGLFQYNNNNINKIISSSIEKIIMGSDKSGWALGDSLYKFDGTKWKSLYGRDPANLIVPQAIDVNGNTWFSRFEISGIDGYSGDTNWRGKGLNSYDGVEWRTYTKIDGLVNDYVLSITTGPDGVLWVGTLLGLSRFNNSSWTSYTTADGLPDNTINAISISDHGTVYVGTPKGVSRFIGSVGKIDENSNNTTNFTGIHPNPFNPSTTISFSLPAASIVNLFIFDITGRKICTLLSGSFSEGIHSVIWNGRNDAMLNVSSGVYIARLESGEAAQNMKMLLIR